MTWPEGSVHFVHKSPIGDLYLIACEKGLCALLWPQDFSDLILKNSIESLPSSAEHPVIRLACQQLEEYFRGERKDFDLPLVTLGTEFQLQAWNELRKIPYGKTISYKDQALRLGDIKKARAVGTANGRNLISIFIPCHRVVTHNGQLGGYRGGLVNKKYLLDLEQR